MILSSTHIVKRSLFFVFELDLGLPLHVCKSTAREDIYEIYLEPNQLTFDELKKACAKEFECNPRSISKIVKLSNNMEVILKNDRNVQSLKDEELLIVYIE
jgi:hypothetical protein